MISSLSLFLMFPIWMPASGLSNFGRTAPQDSITVAYANLSGASTTSGWSDLYGGTMADDAGNAIEYELASYSRDPVLADAAFDRDSLSPPDSAMNKEESDNITGVIAIVLLMGALRLYFKSPGFRNFLFETFSPLSPLGY